MIDGYVDEYENAFLQDLSLSEFSHTLGHKRKSLPTFLMSVKRPKAEVIGEVPANLVHPTNTPNITARTSATAARNATDAHQTKPGHPSWQFRFAPVWAFVATTVDATFTLRLTAVMLVTEATGANESNSPKRVSGAGHHGTSGSGTCGAA